MEQMRFDVTVTSHDLLKLGITEHRFRRVTVVAETYTAGRELAAQFVLALEAIRRTGLDMVTNAYPVI